MPGGTGTLQVDTALPGGSHLSFDVVATIAGDTGVNVVNTAEIISPIHVNDPSNTNNSSSASVLIVPDGIFVAGFEQENTTTLANPAAEAARNGVR